MRSEVSTYNGFFTTVVKGYSRGRYEKFWRDFVVPDGIRISLITASESSASTISELDSEKFLEDADVIQSVAPAAADSGDNDMFDLME